MIVYLIKNGFKNLGTKKLFTFASIGTISCSCIIFCIFFALMANVSSLIHTVETSIGVQVFFDENLNDEQIQMIANNNFYTDSVKSIRFISSTEAWDKFKKDYFQGHEELAEAFENDNPLSKSASYEILLNDIEKQSDYVNFIKNIDGVRQVNYSSSIVDILVRINNWITYFSIALIIILVIIAIILISNTIAMSSELRKHENEIMKLIGATKYMIRGPFVIEGIFIGLIGSILPLIFVGFGYDYVVKRFLGGHNTMFNTLFTPINLSMILPNMSAIAIGGALILCTVVSFLTVSKSIKI